MNINERNLRTMHFLIMGVLQNGPAHGYQIHKEIKDEHGLGRVWHVKITNIYGLLDHLVKKNCIEQIESPSGDDSYPPKKYFQLTEEGKNTFNHWLSQPVSHGREIRQEFLSKLYFLQEDNERLIKIQLEECQKWLAKQQTYEQEAETRFIHLVQSYRTAQIKSMIDWLEKSQQGALT